MSTIDFAYHRFNTERFPLPSEADVAELEQRIGAEFPEDYRQFLLDYNGGFFSEPTITPTTENCPELGLTSLYGINATHPTSELCSASDLALFSDNDPLQILPIGDTTSGGLIVLGLCDEERGAIFLKKAFGDFYYLTDGVEEFFGLLEQPTPNE